MPEIKTFRFSEEAESTLEIRAVRSFSIVDDEGLTGEVRGKDASDLEERVARSFRKFNVRFAFKIYLPTLFSFPGQDKELDFLFWDGPLLQPLGVKGYIGHNTQAQQQDDYERESLLNIEFQKMGWMPFKDVKWPRLTTQESTDLAIGEII